VNKRGIAVIGPALILVNIFVVLITAFKITAALGLVSGFVFNKKIRELGWSFILPRLIAVITIAILVILGVHYTVGPTANHYVAMLYGTLIFCAIITGLSIKSIKQHPKHAILEIVAVSLIFMAIALLSVYLVAS
jgi:hypothetical protein